MLFIIYIYIIIHIYIYNILLRELSIIWLIHLVEVAGTSYIVLYGINQYCSEGSFTFSYLSIGKQLSIVLNQFTKIIVTSCNMSYSK